MKDNIIAYFAFLYLVGAVMIEVGIVRYFGSENANAALIWSGIGLCITMLLGFLALCIDTRSYK